MSLFKQLHSVKLFRQIAKIFFKNATIKQRFYQGTICLNAVEHSWAWTGKNSYETFDLELQNAIYNASFNHDLLIDIGSNIGAITVGTLLHNPAIKVIAVDPNINANKLLKKTLLLNHLTNRCEVINAVIGNQNGVVSFDETGSVTGHVASHGKTIRQLEFSAFLNQHQARKTLVKIDVEGYESLLVENLNKIEHLSCYTFFIEVHALNFNGTGNPEKVFASIKAKKGLITDLNGLTINHLPAESITQIIVKFDAA